jgi:hypothetical protein
MQGRKMRRSLPARFENERDHTFKVVADICRRNAQGFHALRRQPSISTKVALRVVPEIVGRAIDLNARRHFVAEEVESVAINRVLAAELEAVGPEAKHIPQTPLRRRHILAQSACSLGAQSYSSLLNRAATS